MESREEVSLAAWWAGQRRGVNLSSISDPRQAPNLGVQRAALDRKVNTFISDQHNPSDFASQKFLSPP